MKMKSIIAVVVMMWAGFAAAQEAIVPKVTELKKAGNREAILKLLPSCKSAVEKHAVYYNAMMMLPAGERAAYIQSIEDAAFRDVMTCYNTKFGPECNALCSRALEVYPGILIAKRFKPEFATKEQCVAYYQLVLRVLKPGTINDAYLEEVKGELQKLQDTP
jgi:hypothetical protein